MNKMRSTIKISIFILLIFTLTIIPTVSAEVNGFTLKAATLSQPVSNNKDLEDANMTILVGAGSGGALYGKFGNEQLTQWIPNLLFEHPIIFEMSPIIETADYPIRNQEHSELKRLEYEIRGNWFFSEKCKSTMLYCFDVGSGKIIEIKEVDVGRYGSIDNPNLFWGGNVKVTINGIPYSKDISSNIESVQFNSITGEFVALIRWVGSTVTGQGLPDQHNNVPIYNKDSNEWSISTIATFRDYERSLLTTEIELNAKQEQKKEFDNKFYEYTAEEYFDKYSICKDDQCSPIVTLINTHNAKLTILLNSRKQISYESDISSKIKQDSNVKDGNVLIVLNRRINIPEFTIITTAKSVGAYIPTGEFEIIDITSPTFSSGDSNGKIDIKIRNTGEYKGTATASLIDDSNTFKQISNSKSLETSLEPSKESIITMYISSGTLATDLSKTAKIDVYDINSPTNVSSKEFTASVTTPKVCQPDSQRLDNKIVYTCNKDGTAEYITLDCTNGIPDYVNDTYKCTQIEYNKDLVMTNIKNPAQIVEVQNKTKTDDKKESTTTYDFLKWMTGLVLLYFAISTIRKHNNKDQTITKENSKQSIMQASLILGIFYVYLQFKFLTETLGTSLFWIIVIISGVIVGLIHIYLKVTMDMKIPKIYILTASIIIFIILSQIVVGIKETACDSWLTRGFANWMFDTCKEWSINNYLPEWMK